MIVPFCHASEQHRDLDTVGVSFFKQRSQGSNTARHDMGITQYLYRFDTCRFNGALAIIPEYTRSFSKDEIAKFLFFNGKSSMQFAESGQPGTDIAPINFLLNQDFSGVISAHPRVQNALVDFNVYLGLDSWLQGLYLQAFAPLCWTKWDINFEQETGNEGTVINANQLGNPAATAAPYTNIIDAWRGDKTFFEVSQQLGFAKVNGGQTEFKLADAQLVLGYTAISCIDSHLSFNLRTFVPTGNKSNGVYFFEPMVGNGHHVEFGAGVNGHITIWQCQPDKKIVAFMDGTIFHMFKNRQTRTFDLKLNGKGSRYLLFKRFNENGQYAGEILQGPNILTRQADIHVGVHGDATLLLEYRSGNLVADVGYNLWGRHGEEIDNIEPIAQRTYGLKGDTLTSGLSQNATASRTTISGMNAEADLNPEGVPIAVFINPQDLDPNSAASPGAFTHKLYFYLGYAGHQKYLKPFFGVGLEAEFSGRDNNALRQVGVLIKSGLAF